MLQAACLILGVAGVTAAPAKNVLFFLVDDGGFESPVWGNTALSTPHISALAANGTIFKRAYTAVSSCSPSRAAILSGLPTHQNGMYGLHQNPGNFQANADITSLPNLLNKAGYKTGIVGKHHVGPVPNFDFTYGTTSEYCWAGALGNPMNFGDHARSGCHRPYNSVARNLTNMKLHTRRFLRLEPEKPFFLYVGFGDVHRCKFKSAVGSFCEFYGSGKNGQGVIPDWTPTFYNPKDVVVPPFLPDNDAVREDIAAQYTAWGRLDQGVGLIKAELDSAGVLDDTLIIFFSDNGIPFPSGKTNLLEQGQREPLIISTPQSRAAQAGGHASELVVSALDLLPTILDWAHVDYPSNASARGAPAHLTGASLLPLMEKSSPASSSAGWRNAAYGSHQFHSLYAYYPMRSMVTPQFRLIHNLNYNLRYPILEDVFHTTTWADIEAAGESGDSNSTGWVYNYHDYMFRPEWQLFDLTQDPLCLDNLAKNKSLEKTLLDMQRQLRQWQVETSDPWVGCNPAVPGPPGEAWAATHSEICAF
eukprot:g4289.t1